MNRAEDILISVEERYAVSMLSGEKSVELRRKPLNIQPGTRVWIYSKLPKGEVQALGVVSSIVAASPQEIWEKYGPKSAITHNEFSGYFAGAEVGYAIVFECIHALQPILSLSSIREKISHFHPPQFFKRLASTGPELAFFETAIAAE
jgi:predicted transcriptional regulator